MKERLARHRRQKDGIPFVLTSRDVEILKAINRYRYLRTGQVKTLLFRQNSDMQPVRRRLRGLFQNAYLGRISQPVWPCHGSAEEVYFLDQGGEQFLRDYGEDVISFSNEEVRHRFVEHALAVSEFRMNVELGLREHPIVQLELFHADFELKKRYRHVEDGQNPLKGSDRSAIFPDAVMVLRGRGNLSSYLRLIFIEIDRGSEVQRILQEKTTSYARYQANGAYSRFGEFKSFRVLIQTTSPERALNTRQALEHIDGKKLVWVTDVGKVREDSLFDQPIWLDETLRPRRLVSEPAARTSPKERHVVSDPGERDVVRVGESESC